MDDELLDVARAAIGAEYGLSADQASTPTTSASATNAAATRPAPTAT